MHIPKATIKPEAIAGDVDANWDRQRQFAL